jgi:hypothetical protein
MTTIITIGIDPGRKGAIVALTGNPEAPTVVGYWPASQYYPDKHPLSARRFGEILANFSAREGVIVYLEAPGYRPGEGTVSTAATASGHGRMAAIVEWLGIPIHDVPAATWTKALGVTVPKRADGAQASDREKKEKHLSAVEHLLPTLPFRTPRGAVADGYADAACIALYGLRKATMRTP